MARNGSQWLATQCACGHLGAFERHNRGEKPRQTHPVPHSRLAHLSQRFRVMTKRLLLLAATCSAVALATSTTALAASATPSGSFLSANLPGTAEDVSGVRDTIVGDIKHNTLSADSGDAELSITATQLPGVVTAVTTDNMLYRKARGELVGNYDGRVVGWSECSHAGYDCRMLRYDTADGRHGMARLYLDDGVLVVVNAVYGEDKSNARKFLASAH